MRVSDIGELRDPIGIRELSVDQAYRTIGRRHRRDIGQVTYGRWQVDRLHGASPIAEMPRPDPVRWDLYLTEVPHSLRFHTPDETPRWVSVAFEVTTADTTAYDLLPRSVAEKQSAAAIYTISSALRFTNADGGLRGSPHEICLTRLVPIVRSMGLGERLFGWQYEAPPREALAAGDRTGCVILQVPKGLTEINVRAAARFPVDRRFAGGRSEPFGFTVELPG